jgi:hypothetical protein
VNEKRRALEREREREREREKERKRQGEKQSLCVFSLGMKYGFGYMAQQTVKCQPSHTLSQQICLSLSPDSLL